MASLEATTFAAIDAWLAGFTWTTAPNRLLEAHESPGATTTTEEDDDTPRLPTLDMDMPSADELLYNQPLAREDSPTDQIVFELGRMEGKARFIFQCDSKAQAEVFREEWRRNTFQSMLADGEHKMPVVKQLPATYFGVVDHIRVMLEPQTFLFQPTSEDTVLEDRWVLRHDALISYPLFEVEPLPGTGTMDVIIEHLRCS
jgi:hypothetical protein